MRYTGRITGTFNDDFDVEADSEEEARSIAMMGWSYVEYEDMDVAEIKEVDDAG